MPDGSQTVFTVTGDAGSRAVACVALTPRQTAVLADQYRPGPERLMRELPGGGVEPGESLAGGAARELAEETGYVPEELIYLMDDPGVLSLLAFRPREGMGQRRDPVARQPADRFVPAVGWDLPVLAYALD